MVVTYILHPLFRLVLFSHVILSARNLCNTFVTRNLMHVYHNGSVPGISSFISETQEVKELQLSQLVGLVVFTMHCFANLLAR